MVKEQARQNQSRLWLPEAFRTIRQLQGSAYVSSRSFPMTITAHPASETPVARQTESRFPHLEPTGPVIPMTEEQKFVFDLKGWLLLPAVLERQQIEALRAHVEALV